MEFNELYRAVIELYLGTKSIKETSEILKVSSVKVRRILITEGLWSSKTSREIGALYKEGLTTEEIAEKLCTSLKNVQAYIPYSRGIYGEEETSDSVRSGLYRDRKQMLVKAAAMPNIPESVSKDFKPYIKGRSIHAEESPQLEIGKAVPFALQQEEGFELKLELVDESNEKDYQKLSELDAEIYSDLLRLARAEKGISRTVIVPGEMTLHSLHYLICKAFGFLNGHLHRFSLLESDFNCFTKDSYSKWERYQGSLFAAPEEDEPADHFIDDDYDGRYSFNKWLKSKYQESSKYYSASDTYILQKIRIGEFESYLAKIFNESREEVKKRSLSELGGRAFVPGHFRTILERLTLSEIFTPDTHPEEILSQSKISSSIAHAEDNIGNIDSKELSELIRYLKKYVELYKEILSLKERGEIKSYPYHPILSLLMEYEVQIQHLKELIWPAVDAANPRLEPFANKLLYSYDFGDNWKVLITCNRRITGKVEKPECIASDGLNLIDNCGGICGYIETLEKISGEYGDEEQEDTYYWARSMGFTGRKNSPKNII